MQTLTCAACGRSLAEASAWKGNGERYYCNDFCAETEESESPALVPGMSEDAAASPDEGRFLAKLGWIKLLCFHVPLRGQGAVGGSAVLHWAKPVMLLGAHNPWSP